MREAAEPIERRVALRTGLTYSVLEWGADAATDHTVLLVHGYLDFAWSWDAVARRLAAAKLHVIAPDLRGHGDSDRVGAGGYYHGLDYIADLFEVVRLCTRKKLSLCGHSMGGNLSAYYASVYPQQLAHLAIVEGLNAPEQSIQPELVAAWVADWTGSTERSAGRRGMVSVADAAERLRKHDDQLDPRLALWLAERGTRRRADGRYEFKHDPLLLAVAPSAFIIDDVSRFWRRITCPTLIVDGEGSSFRLTEAEAARRHGSFVDARRVIVAGAAHMMQRHHAAELAQLLLDFFSAPCARS